MSGAGYGSTGGSDRDSAGSTGSRAMGDRSGSGEVHSGLHSGGQRDDYSGLGFAGSGGGRSGGASGTARGAADTAGGAASGARGRLGALSERANSALEGRGIIARLQENPLPALGVAFAVGFLVAGGTNVSTRPNSPAARARQELRGALMAGLSSGVSQGARGFLDTAGRPEGFANSFLRNVLSSVLSGAGGGDDGGREGGGREGGGREGGGREGGGQQRSQGGGGQGRSGGGMGGGRSGGQSQY